LLRIQRRFGEGYNRCVARAYLGSDGRECHRQGGVEIPPGRNRRGSRGPQRGERHDHGQACHARSCRCHGEGGGALEQFCFSSNRIAVLSICFDALSYAKPLSTFAGNALERFSVPNESSAAFLRAVLL